VPMKGVKMMGGNVVVLLPQSDHRLCERMIWGRADGCRCINPTTDRDHVRTGSSAVSVGVRYVLMRWVGQWLRIVLCGVLTACRSKQRTIFAS